MWTGACLDVGRVPAAAGSRAVTPWPVALDVPSIDAAGVAAARHGGANAGLAVDRQAVNATADRPSADEAGEPKGAEARCRPWTDPEDTRTPQIGQGRA